ncbi:MAG: GAF domain-containing protein, partial [Candidatus Promineifilaceae bacterium]
MVAKQYGYHLTCAVPLMREGSAVGVITIRSRITSLLSDKQIELLQSFANQAAIAVENVRLFNETVRLLEETEQRNGELAIINSVQEGLAAELDIDAIYELVGEKIREIFDSQVVFIIGYDEEYKERTFHYVVERGKRIYLDPRPLNELHRNIVQRRKVMVFNENTQTEMQALGAITVPGTESPKSAVYAPLVTGERVLGVITLQNLDHEHAYSKGDIRLLQTLANSMIVTLENARLFDETQRLLAETEQRNAELAIINTVQQGLVAEADYQGIIDLVGDKLREIFNTGDLGISVYDPQTSMFNASYVYEHGERLTIPPEPVIGINKVIFETGQPLVINKDIANELAAIGGSISPGTDMAKAVAVVPILLAGQVTGLIQLENHEKENAFSDSDVSLMQTLANSMSVALENARLFDETNQRAAELAIINSVQEGLAAELDIQAIYDLVGEKIRDVFNAQAVLIASYNYSPDIKHLRYSVEKGERFYLDSQSFNDFDRYLMKNRETILINENAAELSPQYGLGIVSGTEEVLSMLFVPLIIGGQVSGYFSLQDVDREHAFSESDVRLLNTIANSMSAALENARLFDETQRLLAETEQRNAELAIINTVQQGLVAEADFQGIIDLVGDKLREVFNTGDLSIGLYDLPANLVKVVYFYEHGERGVIPPLPIIGVGRTILESGKPLIVNEDIANAMAAIGSEVIPGTDAPKSMLAAPILLGNQVTGLIQLENHEREGAFSDSDVSLMQTLANSMSVALENARLFEETNQRAAELAIINSVQAGLAAELDIQAIYKLVGDEIRDIFDAQVVTVNTLDLDARLNNYVYIWEDGYSEPHTRPFTELTQRFIDNQAPLLVNEGVEEMLSAGGHEIISGDMPKSFITIPLWRGKEISGYISLQNLDREFAFKEDDVRLLSTLANSMSVALENARLFAETQRLLTETEQRNAELAIINTVQHGLVAEADYQGIIDLVGDKLREIFDTGNLSIDFINPQTNLVSTPYFYEHGVKLEMPDFPNDKGLPKILSESREPLVINEQMGSAMETLGLFVVPGTEIPKSMMAVPLFLGSQVIGGIQVENHHQEQAFSDSDVRLLQTLGNSMSVALENARLFDETTQRAAELSIINMVQKGLAAELDLQAIYELVGDKIQEIFDAQVVFISVYDEDYEEKSTPYMWEKGERYFHHPLSLNQLHRSIISERRVLVFNENTENELEELGAQIIPGTEMPKSAVFAPLISGERVYGVIGLQNLDHENAYSESDVRLLSTLASSMSVAMENARLFDETQRLLTETEQRNAELAIINTVQQGLVAEADYQGIIDLVGDKLREVFNTGDLKINFFEPAANLAQVYYAYEHGERLPIFSHPIIGIAKAVFESAKPLIINEDVADKAEELGSTLVPGTDVPKSL